jgi:hypothetical protein
MDIRPVGTVARVEIEFDDGEKVMAQLGDVEMRPVKGLVERDPVGETTVPEGFSRHLPVMPSETGGVIRRSVPFNNQIDPVGMRSTFKIVVRVVTDLKG